jgi:hypothetical protein
MLSAGAGTNRLAYKRDSTAPLIFDIRNEWKS